MRMLGLPHLSAALLLCSAVAMAPPPAFGVQPVPPGPPPLIAGQPAPDLDSSGEWLDGNGRPMKPLKLKDLRGKFVILDFWTFC